LQLLQNPNRKQALQISLLQLQIQGCLQSLAGMHGIMGAM